MPAPAIVSDRAPFANAMPSSQLHGPSASATPTAQPIARPHAPFLHPSRSHASFEHLNSSSPRLSPWDFPRSIVAAKTSAPPFASASDLTTSYFSGNAAGHGSDAGLNANHSHRHEAYAQPTARRQHLDYVHEGIQGPSISSHNAPGTLFSSTSSSADTASPLSSAAAQGQSMKPSVQSQQEQIQAIIARLEKMRPGFSDSASSPSLAGAQPRHRLSVPPLPHPSTEGPQLPRTSATASNAFIGPTATASDGPGYDVPAAYQGWNFDRPQLVNASGAPFYVAPQPMQGHHALLSTNTSSYFPIYMPVEDHAIPAYAGTTEPIDFVAADLPHFKAVATAAGLSELSAATSAVRIPAVRPSHKIEDTSSSFYMGWTPSPTESNSSSLSSTTSFNSMTSSSISSNAEIPAKTELPPKQRKESLYKTELCRSFEEKGHCDYGVKCQFAHGKQELRTIQRHPKWKTELCRTFWRYGACAYAKRCCFIHELNENSGVPAQASSKTPLIERLRNTTAERVNTTTTSTYSEATTTKTTTTQGPMGRSRSDEVLGDPLYRRTF